MINRETISDLSADACRLYNAVSILAYHIVSRRVTHTSKTLGRLLMPMARIVNQVQSLKSFADLIKQSFERSVDRHGGSHEIELYPDGTIWVHGSFRLEELRKHLVTVPQHVTIQMERQDEC